MLCTAVPASKPNILYPADVLVPHCLPSSLTIMSSPSGNTDPSRPFTARVEEIPALVDDLDRFGLTVQLDDASDSTASDLVGPGLLVGKLISRTGTGFEKLVGNVAERLGMGPNAIFDRILTKLTRVHDLWLNESRREHGFPAVSVAGHRSFRFLQPPRRFQSLVEGATKLPRPFFMMEEMERVAATGVQADCRKLAAFLRQ
ncbi:hypothetical protein JAAARDRAFT_480700 [Jaapia argillacea MUCL 33604]|uniref:Uncharacterized protein n=1 Tax=Jaapia argillacea MUCL 33604 TaxID=933084 RepID=A0A067PCF6_9AGAM|nr:hypothetical protein JAAARDRAFT_480700 [Jaapia argillacea MUCL 33604]